MKIEYSVNQQSGPKIPIGFWQKTLKKIEKNVKLGGRFEVSIAVVGQAKIRTLNRIYRRKDKITDVLSFAPAKEIGPYNHSGYLGEIIICYPQAKKQAQKAKINLTTEFETLLIHGILHLLGYDHEKISEAEKMEELQEKIKKTKI